MKQQFFKHWQHDGQNVIMEHIGENIQRSRWTFACKQMLLYIQLDVLDLQKLSSQLILQQIQPLFVWLMFNGTFSTTRLYRAIEELSVLRQLSRMNMMRMNN